MNCVVEDVTLKLTNLRTGNPYIQYIEGLLTDEELRYFAGFRSEDYHASSTTNGVSQSRTSSSLFLDRKDRMVRRVMQRVSTFTHMPMEHIETLQLTRYKNKQEYRPHYDLLYGDNERILTIFVYITSSECFGGTYFPKLGIEIKPSAGSAVLFTNRTPNLEDEKLSFHAGMPNECDDVDKIGMNIWIRQKPYVSEEVVEDRGTICSTAVASGHPIFCRDTSDQIVEPVFRASQVRRLLSYCHW